MALGGGKWFSENKKLPGSYINFEGSPVDAAGANYPANGGADPFNPYALPTYDLGADELFYGFYIASAYLFIVNDVIGDIVANGSFPVAIVLSMTEIV